MDEVEQVVRILCTGVGLLCQGVANQLWGGGGEQSCMLRPLPLPIFSFHLEEGEGLSMQPDYGGRGTIITHNIQCTTYV